MAASSSNKSVDTTSRYWMFTLNNPQPEEDPKTWGYHFLAYQLEKGADGTPHYQGYITFKKSKRFSGMKKLNPRAHWSMRKGSHDQALAYVTKEETRQEGPWVLGNKPQQGKRTDLDKVKDDLDAGVDMKTIADKHWGHWLKYRSSFEKYAAMRTHARQGKPMVEVHFGPPGVGKTTAVFEKIQQMGLTYYQKDPKSKWWDGYENQDVVVFEEYVGSCVAYSSLKTILDVTPAIVEVKGGSRRFTSSHVFFISNVAPQEWYSEKHNHMELHRRIDVCYQYTACGVVPIEVYNHMGVQYHCPYDLQGCPVKRIIELQTGKRLAPEPPPTHSPSGRPLSEYDDLNYVELDCQNRSKVQRTQ